MVTVELSKKAKKNCDHEWGSYGHHMKCYKCNLVNPPITEREMEVAMSILERNKDQVMDSSEENTVKTCRMERCNKVAGEHMFYDTTLCKDHAYDDELSRFPELSDE